MTDMNSFICMAGTLPLLHDVHCTIKALQARDLYFPDLTKELRKRKSNIRKACVRESSRFSSKSTFKHVLSLRAATGGKAERITSPFCFKETPDHDNRVVHFAVKPVVGGQVTVMLTATPLPTGARGRPSSVRKHVTKSELKGYFAHAEVQFAY
jgi:hypothetical protein